MGLGSTLLPAAVRNSYFRKFVLIVVVVIVATGAFGLFIQGQVSALLTEQTEAEMESTARLNAQYLGEGLQNFETEAEHEFVFSVGPTQ